MKLFKIVDDIEKVLPKDLIGERDNSGLLVGDRQWEVKHIRVALEATIDVINSAVEDEVDLLIVHHPMIFGSMRQVTSDSVEGRKVIQLIENKMALYAAHSNLDRTTEGMNQVFGKMAGLEDIHLADFESDGYILKGLLPNEYTMASYIKFLEKQFNLKGTRYVGEPEDTIRSVGFCTGSGMSMIGEALFEEVDVYLTGDLKYHEAMWLYETGHKVIDVTHFGSEAIGTEVIYNLITKVLDNRIKVTKDTAIQSPIKISEV